MPFKIGGMVGPYEIQTEIGRGGMATVYKAYHASLDRYVAIKVMDATLSKEYGFIERFKREARVIAKLENPHIVPVYDFDEHDGQLYLVMKFVDGQTLWERMKAARLSKSEIMEIVTAVGDGLQYAHARGVLHRDIKPSNVMLAKDGGIYLADFGLARVVESDSSLTSDMIVGTPHYMSPEQALNEKVDARTDIYSFGVMIYEMVLGRLPYDSTTAFSIIEDHIKTPPLLPTIIDPDLPVEVELVLLKALSKQRSERFDNVLGLVQAFQQAWTPSASLGISSAADRLPNTGPAVLLTQNGSSFLLASERAVLGRNSETKDIQNDIDLRELDTKKIISRRHAMIVRQNNDYVLHDLNSRNGTFVNGQRIQPRQPHKLIPGDVVEFGLDGVKLTFTR